MSDQTVVAAPSAAVVEAEAPSIEIPRSGTTEYAKWRIDGTLPEKKSEPKPAESLAADNPKEDSSANNAPEPEAGNQPQEQKKRRPDIEERFKKFTDRIKELEAKLEQASRPQPTQADSSTAKPAEQQPQTYQEWRKTIKASEWIQRYIADHPGTEYEDGTAALADYLADVRSQFQARDQQIARVRQRVDAAIAEAKQRYSDFPTVARPVLEAVYGLGATHPVAQLLNDSPVGADLLYTIGTAEDRGEKFLNLCKTSPTQATRIAVEMERLVQEKLSGKEQSAERNEKGQFTPKENPAPAKRGPESAPEPPLEIGNRGSGPTDEQTRALQQIERGNERVGTRAWLDAENRRLMARRRGA